MNYTLGILLSVCLVPAALGAAKKVALDPTCGKKADSFLTKKWHGLEEWRPVISRDAHVSTLRSPTDTVGVWVEKALVADQVVEVTRISATELTRVNFGEKCKPTERKIPLIPEPEPEHAFTDEKLAAEVASGKPGVVYVWSPHMQISILGLVEALSAGKNAKVRVIPVLSRDSDVSYALEAKAVHQLELDPILVNHSLELSMRSIEQHLPSMILYKNRAIINTPFRGYEDRETYEKLFHDYLSPASVN